MGSSLNGTVMGIIILDPRVIGPGLVLVIVIGCRSDNYCIRSEPNPLTGLHVRDTRLEWDATKAILGFGQN